MARISKRGAVKRSAQALQAFATVQQFLAHCLPPAQETQAAYFADAIAGAGRRYDRYAARKSEWDSYANRRRRLNKIAAHIDGLEAALVDLDIISRDDFASRMDPTQLETLVGSLRLLKREVAKIASNVQRIGRGRDLAEERWILELADIYENAIGQRPRVGKKGQRDSFYELLQISRPNSYPRYGKLSIRQIKRILDRRKSSIQISI